MIGIISFIDSNWETQPKSGVILNGILREHHSICNRIFKNDKGEMKNGRNIEFNTRVGQDFFKER